MRVSCQRATLAPLVESAIAASGVAATVHDGPAHTLQRAAYLSLVVSGTAGALDRYRLCGSV